LLGHHGEAECDEQAKDRIGGVEASQDEALEQQSEQRDRDRRERDRRAEADMLGERNGDVGAEGVERAGARLTTPPMLKISESPSAIRR